MARLLDSLKSTTSQRILVKSPPASGKTALLQGVVRGLLEKGNVPIIVRGTAHDEDLQLVAKLRSIIIAAPVGSVLIVDDAQLLYHNESFWRDMIKGERAVHLLAAASYGASKAVPDTPAVFARVVGFWECSFDSDETIALATSVFKASSVPLDQQAYATELFAQQCRVLGVPALHQPMELLSGGEQEDEDKHRHVHIGLFRRLLEGFVGHFRKPGRTPSAWEFLSSPDLLIQDHIKERCFGAFQMDLSDAAKRCLSNLLVLSCPVTLEELVSQDMKDQGGHDDAIKMLIRTCAIVEVGDKVDFSTPCARRVYFRKIYPSRGLQEMLYSSIDTFIIDAVSMFDPAMLRHGMKSSQRGTFPSEAVLQQEFCRAAAQLLPPSVLFCPELAAFVKSGRVDFFIGGWAVELLRLGDGIKSHRDRFFGKYMCTEITEFRIVDFKLADQKPSFDAIKEYPTVHLAIVFSEDFTRATVFQGQPTDWATSSIQLGQDLRSIVSRRSIPPKK